MYNVKPLRHHRSSENSLQFYLFIFINLLHLLVISWKFPLHLWLWCPFYSVITKWSTRYLLISKGFACLIRFIDILQRLSPLFYISQLNDQRPLYFVHSMKSTWFIDLEMIFSFVDFEMVSTLFDDLNMTYVHRGERL